MRTNCGGWVKESARTTTGPAEAALVADSLRGRFAFVEESADRRGLRAPQIGALHAMLAHRSVEDFDPIVVVSDQADELTRRANVIVTTAHALNSCSPQAREALVAACERLFVDEARHMAARTWRSVAEMFMPTGTGKTDTMLAAFCHTPVRTLIVVPSDALRTQIAEKFVTLGILPGIGAFTGELLCLTVLVLEHGLETDLTPGDRPIGIGQVDDRVVVDPREVAVLLGQPQRIDICDPAPDMPAILTEGGGGSWAASYCRNAIAFLTWSWA